MLRIALRGMTLIDHPILGLIDLIMFDPRLFVRPLARRQS
jgi:hypothetical protein